MIFAASLLAISASTPTIPVARLYVEFSSVCGGAIDPESIDKAASTGGWSKIALEADPKLAAEIKQYDGQMWSDWHFQHAFYEKAVEGRHVYLHASTGTPDGATVYGCAVYDLERTSAPGTAEVQQAVGKPLEYVSTDFGGSTFDFAEGTLPSGGHVEISWLTHKINPQFTGDRQLETSLEGVVGPKRPPTLTIKTIFVKKAS